MLTRLSRRALAVALAVALPTSASEAQTIDYSWTGTEYFQWFRYSREGGASDWQAAPKAFPGTALPYDGGNLVRTFEFVNPFDFATGFQVTNVVNYDAAEGFVGQYAGGVHLLAFLGSYNPFEPAEGYLGDAGVSCHGACDELANFSVLVPANATVQLLALRMHGGSDPGSRFTLDAGFIGTPVVTPEPSTWLLMAAGLTGIGAVARKRRARAA